MPEVVIHFLDGASTSHTMPIPADAAVQPDFLLLPDAPAVVVIETVDGKTILIATTASARELARRRLSPTQSADARSPIVDHRAICSGGCVQAIQVGSSLEADAVYLRQARDRLPHLAKVVSERWRAWFTHVDPDADFPQWTKTNLMIGLVGKRSASSDIGNGKLPAGILLGPLPDKDAAGRFIEAMIDCFDLCRFHNLLVQAPKAAACAYKEMGRCAAPCDGTETMAAYRDRIRAAVEFIATGTTPTTFDSKQAARLQTLRKPAFAHVTSLNDSALLLLLPSPVSKHVRFVLAHRGRLLRMADIDPTDSEAASRAATAAEVAVKTAPPLRVEPDHVDTIALTARWLFMPEKKRRGVMFRLDRQALESDPSPLEPKVLLRAAKSVLARAQPGEQTVETHEIEP
jgi:hypothetical protein